MDDVRKFDAVVIAAGIESRNFAALTPELAVLEPIKGQLVSFTAQDQSGPILRSAEIYLVSQDGEVLAGASMETGKDDRMVDAATLAELRGRAVRLRPELEICTYSGRAGVRASTPDGLPMAGPSSRPGVYLATGARRNGWLLAPLVSEILVSYFCGGDGGPFAAALDPRRFTRA